MSHFEAPILKSRYGYEDGFSLVGQSIKEVFTDGTVEILLCTGIFNVGQAIDKDNSVELDTWCPAAYPTVIAWPAIVFLHYRGV